MKRSPVKKIHQIGLLQGNIDQSSLDSIPLGQKRKTITELITNIQIQSKKGPRDTLNLEPMEQKDSKIKQLQEQIINKKIKNDLIQKAFKRRHSSQVSSQKQSISLYTLYLLSNCLILARFDRAFKRNLLKILLSAVRMQKNNQSNVIKMVLLWVIDWINKLFLLLSGHLIKKN